ncbi:cytoplasm protein [Arthroderma uncinatum]|uniref:cytoplasm protein n=1 Tax=Arthroderma uncinatum TaxID=74035 RepID=UPI00144AD958|nr:cytoplasm protein [Arthroderma uncinatum]KAF3481506.1 cytoplasm protein [Arthroderma uncinatum]
MAPSDSQKRLALAIIDFLNTSVKDGTLAAEDAESIEIATSCLGDTFQVDPTDEAAMKDALSGQSLLNIYSVYEKVKGKNTSAASETKKEPSKTAPQGGAPTPESDKLKSEGNAAMGRKDYPAAIDCYSRALEIAPSNPIYLSNRAAAYSASGDHTKAAADAEVAVAADPKYVKAWSRLGLARFALGDAKSAAEAYEKGIQAEGNGGSDAMKRGLETAKKRIAEMEKVENEPPAEAVDDAAGASRGAPGGMPDLASLAGMLGGGGGGGGMPDFSSLMNNPMFANMAQNLMSNPDMMSNLMNNPALRQMADNFGGGGGRGGGGGGAGGLPDMSALLNDPNLADMAKNFMGGRGAGRGTGPSP